VIIDPLIPREKGSSLSGEGEKSSVRVIDKLSSNGGGGGLAEVRKFYIAETNTGREGEAVLSEIWEYV